jgi:hypothetical protein
LCPLKMIETYAHTGTLGTHKHALSLTCNPCTRTATLSHLHAMHACTRTACVTRQPDLPLPAFPLSFLTRTLSFS